EIIEYNRLLDSCIAADITSATSNINDSCFRGYHDMYPYEKMVDCSYSTAATEICFIPNSKRGEWYILLITNYSQMSGDISFNKHSGEATTNCNIIIDATSTGPYCEGDDIELTVNNAPDGAVFKWRGPNGFSSNERSPIINNATTVMAGSYYVQMTSNDITSNDIEVVVEVNKPYKIDTTVTINEEETFIFGDLTLNESGTYTHTFTSSAGCDSVVNLTLEVLKKNDVKTENNGPVCEGETIVLSSIGLPINSTFTWEGPNGFTSTDASPKITNASTLNAGKYSLKIESNGMTYLSSPTTVIVNKKYEIEKNVTVSAEEGFQFGDEIINTTTSKTKTFTSAEGCDSTVTVHVTVTAIEITTSNSGPTCEGDNVVLSATGIPTGASVSWTGPKNFASQSTSTTIINAKPENSGKYELTVTINSLEFKATATDVIVHPNKTVDTTFVIKDGEQIQVGNQTYSEHGDYIQTTTTSNGCDSIINISVIKLDLKTSNSGPYCEGESIQLTAENVPDNVESMKWTGPNEFSSSKSVATVKNASVSNSGTYSFSIEMNGNTYEAPSTIVEVHPNVSMKLFQELAFGSTLQFGELVIEKAGNYEQRFSTLEGCDSIVNMTVKVVFPESVAILPSTHVSPNGDGYKDVWIIENIEKYPNSVVTIFDRNGKQLMEYKNYKNSNGWDGTDGHGNALPSTDYWYTINIPETDKVYVGHFTLLRR
ncbi:MAG TPA: T9SS type B sorting domain-containing protein, partial [Paludibacteraceae bacterium]|nr:T9SS type B sorting domain-containing protein [Paludibacteraceae bacterium]